MGNAVINDITDLKGIYDYALGHTIISKEVYDGITRDCDFSKERQTRNCAGNIAKFLKAYSDIDIFSVFSPICHTDSERPASTKPIIAPHALTQHVSIIFMLIDIINSLN